MTRSVYALLSIASLLVCLAVPFLYLRQALSDHGYKTLLLAASAMWFFAAIAWMSRAGRRQ
jgi:hypothetical protein